MPQKDISKSTSLERRSSPIRHAVGFESLEPLQMSAQEKLSARLGTVVRNCWDLGKFSLSALIPYVLMSLVGFTSFGGPNVTSVRYLLTTFLIRFTSQFCIEGSFNR